MEPVPCSLYRSEFFIKQFIAFQGTIFYIKLLVFIVPFVFKLQDYWLICRVRHGLKYPCHFDFPLMERYKTTIQLFHDKQCTLNYFALVILAKLCLNHVLLGRS